MKNIPINTIYDNLSFAKDLYNKELFGPSDLNVTNNKTNLDNYVNDYYLNSLKFRDTRDWELGKPAEILALGCSHSYGLGVPQQYNWPSIVESRTGKTVANLSMCGASAETMLQSFLLYLDNVGNPEYVFACFPTHSRYTHIVEGMFYHVGQSVDKETKSKKTISILRTSDHQTGEVNIQDKIFKFPGDPKYLIPTQEAVNQYISSIYMIEKICKFLNIKFYWGTWFVRTQEIFTRNLFLQENFCLDKNNHIKEISSNSTMYEYFDDQNFYREKKCRLTHSMDSDDFEKYKDNMWRVGSDGSHLGIHWQYHTAESFIEKI